MSSPLLHVCAKYMLMSKISFSQGSGNVVLQRAADGTPVQWFVAEDAEIVSQV